MDRFDVLFISGVLLMAIGLSLIYFPLGLIACGAGCVTLALIGARSEARVPQAAPKSAAKDKA